MFIRNLTACEMFPLPNGNEVAWPTSHPFTVLHGSLQKPR